MWVFDETPLGIGIRTVLVYLVVLIGIRLSGKREVRACRVCEAHLPLGP